MLKLASLGLAATVLAWGYTMPAPIAPRTQPVPQQTTIPASDRMERIAALCETVSNRAECLDTLTAAIVRAECAALEREAARRECEDR